MISKTWKSTPILISPIVDLLVLGGISLVVFIICQSADYFSPFLRTNTTGAQLLLVLAFLVNQPHYSATYFRAYGKLSEVKRYSIVTIWLPIALLLLAGWCFWAPTKIAPWFCKAYFVSVSYHYAGQTYGIALIYLRKALPKLTVNRYIKTGLGLPIYSSALLWLVGDEVVSSRRYFSGVELALIGFPSWTYFVSMLFLVSGVMAYLILVFILHFRGLRVPLIVHIVVAAQITWFTMAPRLEFFGLLIPFFHCLQYLLITSYFYFQELLSSGTLKSMDCRQFFVTKYFWRYYLILVFVGFILFNAIPQLVTVMGLANAMLSAAVIHSFINLHHFLLDGEIWKLRKPEVGNLLVRK